MGIKLFKILFKIYTVILFSSLELCQLHLDADNSQIYYSFNISDVKLAEQRVNSELDKFSADHS